MRNILSIHWGLSTGGVATYVATLERLKLRYPVRIRSLCLLKPGREVDAKSLAALDATVIPVGSIFDPSWLRQARAVVLRERPDCIISHGFNGHFVSLLVVSGGMRVNRIATYHGEYHPPTMSRRVIAPVYNGFTHYFLRTRASSVLSVSRAGASILVASGVSGNKITVIHNGIPDHAVVDGARESLRNAWGIGRDEVVIGTASRLEAIKGLDCLIEAFARLSLATAHVRLVIIGEGAERLKLEQRVDALGLGHKVLFTGKRNDIPDCLSAFDIYALPSLSEAHSIGLLEAMRAGKAIVATDVGGNTESVRDGREALIVQAADVAALANALKRLVPEADSRGALGAAARNRFLEEFIESRMLEKAGQWLLDSCPD